MAGEQLISKAVGIDLGTTNSAVAIMDPADRDIIIHRDPVLRNETTPSCVWKDPKSGDIVVGRLAARRVGRSPEPIRSIKRLMGTQTTVRLTDEDVSPEVVSAAILREMKRQIEEDVGGLGTDGVSWIVDRAIVTVPAYFDQPQIEATRKAGEQAGLEIVELLHEPTAAACFHCARTGTQSGLFVVYDFGGGTFDVSVLRATAGIFEVLGISGHTHLGGDDLDAAIAEDIRERLVRTDWSLELDPKADEADRLRLALLHRMAESVKIGLSSSGEFLLRDAMGLTDKEGNPVIPEVMFERPEVESIIRPIVERTIPYCFDALEQAHGRAEVTLADVDAIVLAGGTTHVPLVREVVRDNLCANGEAGRRLADPRADQPRARCSEPVYESVDSVVARGAAMRAAASGGLAVYNAERTVQVQFRGLGTTSATETHLGGKVKALVPEVDVGGGTIRVTIPEQGFEEEEELTDDGAFAFRRLPLQESSENLLSFEVRDRSGAVVATAGRQVRQDHDAGPAGGSEGTAVLSKAILLEVQRAGQLARRTLVEALASLPTEENFDFVHPGDTEVVRFPIYQHKRQIKEILVPVPAALPRGAPIALNIHVDKLAFITVKGKVGDTEFSAAVEPPPERELPSSDELAALERQLAEALEFLPAGQGHVWQLKWDRALAGYQDAAARGDREAALHEFEELEDIIALLSEREGPLQPPKASFDGLVADCYEAHQYAETAAPKAGEPYDADEMKKSIDAQRDEGERAFAASEQQAYSRAIETLQHLKDHIHSVIRKLQPKIGDGDTRTPHERAHDDLEQIRGRANQVRELAMAAERADLRDEVDRIDAELAGLGGEIDAGPDAVREQGQRRLQRLEQIKAMLEGGRRGTAAPVPEDPSLGSRE